MVVRVLPLMVVVLVGCGDDFSSGAGGSGGGASTTTTTSSSGTGGGTTGDPIGCSDGSRELLADQEIYPDIAGCSGGFDVPGVLTSASRAPSCGRGAGNDGDLPKGDGCSVADFCAAGWHVCESAAEVKEVLSGGCPVLDSLESQLWVTRQTNGAGNLDCQSPAGNNLVGCANVGAVAGDSCAPLDRSVFFSHCETNLPDWECGSATDQEGQVVVKKGTFGGGVLCCRD